MDGIVETILIGMFGGFAGSLLTLIAVRWSTLKSIKAAEERLRTELLYEERKRALRKLYHLAEQEYKTYKEFKASVSAFLRDLESEFLPAELKNAIQTEFQELDKFLVGSGLVPPPESDEEAKNWTEEYGNYLKALPEWERAELEFRERFGGLKRSIKHLISQYIKP